MDQCLKTDFLNINNFKKVENIIKFLLTKKYNILVIGNQFDKSIEEIKKFNLNYENEKLDFFINLSDNYSLF